MKKKFINDKGVRLGYKLLSQFKLWTHGHELASAEPSTSTFCRRFAEVLKIQRSPLTTRPHSPTKKGFFFLREASKIGRNLMLKKKKRKKEKL